MGVPADPDLTGGAISQVIAPGVVLVDVRSVRNVAINCVVSQERFARRRLQYLTTSIEDNPTP